VAGWLLDRLIKGGADPTRRWFPVGSMIATLGVVGSVATRSVLPRAYSFGGHAAPLRSKAPKAG
jgi:hypothetical protein